MIDIRSNIWVLSCRGNHKRKLFSTVPGVPVISHSQNLLENNKVMLLWRAVRGDILAKEKRTKSAFPGGFPIFPFRYSAIVPSFILTNIMRGHLKN